MKKIYSLILCMVMTFTLMGVMSSGVKADEATLSDLKVQAQSAAGDLTDVTITPDFSPDVTEYQATVVNDTIKLVLTPTTTEDDATYETDWEALDVGDNTSFVYVTAADGTKTKYTIYTKRLTEDEEATYVPEENNNNSQKSSTKATVKVNGVKMKITSGFTEADIPEGFSETTYQYKKKEYKAIKGDKKNLVALWLQPAASSTDSEEGTDSDSDSGAQEGFYIYDEDAKSFYAMNNIYIKSRMYTVVNVAEPDDILNDYEQTKVTMIDQEVNAWVLDESNSLYLVYAMNWDGETNLYCYDDVEKCFQRYIIENTASEQIEAANKSINTLQDKNNELVKKYNDSNSTKWKIIAVLLIIIVILFFVSLNLALKLKTKKIVGDDEEQEPKNKAPKKKKVKKEEKQEMFDDEELYDDDDDELFRLVEEDDDFIMVENDTASDDRKTEQSKLHEFDIRTDEIDISDQIRKEMKAEEVSASSKNNQPQQVSFKAAEEEPFNEESLKDILSTAFPREASDDNDDDEDGFTFI